MFSLLVGTYVVVALAAFLLADRLIFLPPPPSYAADEPGLRRIPVDGGDSIAVLHLPDDRARFTILHSHGNAEDLGHVRPLLEELRGLGFGVIGYDYRGYGRSDGGRPTARKAGGDAEAVYRFAVDELGIEPGRLILHGRSVGSGPAAALAARHRVAGLVLESAFTSTYRVVTRVGLLPFDRFPNLRHIGDVRCPVLIIHGTHDRVIPVSHGRKLFVLAAEPKRALWVDGAGHNDLVHVAGETYAVALRRFVELLEPESGTPVTR